MLYFVHIFVSDILRYKIMAVNFVLGPTSKEGLAQIKIRVRTTNPPINIKQGTDLYIAPKIWERRGDSKFMDRYQKNESILYVLSLAEEVRRAINAMYEAGEPLTNETVHETISRIVYRKVIADIEEEKEKKRLAEEEANRMTFSRFMDRFYEEAVSGSRVTVHGRRYANYSLTNIRQSIIKFHEFEMKKRRAYDFDDITLDFYYQFSDFLNSRNYAINTVGKCINWIKTFMSLAEVEGYHHNAVYKDKRFKGTRVDVDSIYLTWEDLEKIRDVDISDLPQGYDLARDIFFLGVWTAQRVSDYNNISKDDVKTHKKQKIKEVLVSPDSDETRTIVVEEDIRLIHITQKKTGKKVVIPCSPELLKILEKYDYNVPHLADQKINEYIKVVAERAGLDELIKIDKVMGGKKVTERVPKYKLVHTHTARRTGATLMYLSGMDIFDIMKITGHSSLITLKKYIKADELEVADKIAGEASFFK